MKWLLLTALVVMVAGGTAAAYLWLSRDSGPSGPGRVAFWQAGQLDAPNLYIVTADGKDRPRPTVKGFEPSWSPDGERIAFSVSDEDDAPTAFGTMGIWILSPDASGMPTRRITSPALVADFPAWSPDGRTIAFSGFVQSDEGALPNHEIYVVPADGGTARALTHTPAVDEEEPSWSPDGTKVVYGRWSDDPDDSPDIWIMNSDGSDQRALVSTPDYDHSPAWSPDGEEIAFMRQYPPAGGLSDNNMEIVLVKIDGTSLRRVTRNPYYDSDPAWSPDGERIAFISNRAGSHDVYAIDANGGGLTQLTDHEQSTGALGLPSGEYAAPAWGRSPSS